MCIIDNLYCKTFLMGSLFLLCQICYVRVEQNTEQNTDKHRTEQNTNKQTCAEKGS